MRKLLMSLMCLLILTGCIPGVLDTNPLIYMKIDLDPRVNWNRPKLFIVSDTDIRNDKYGVSDKIISSLAGSGYHIIRESNFSSHYSGDFQKELRDVSVYYINMGYKSYWEQASLMLEDFRLTLTDMKEGKLVGTFEPMTASEMTVVQLLRNKFLKLLPVYDPELERQRQLEEERALREKELEAMRKKKEELMRQEALKKQQEEKQRQEALKKQQLQMQMQQGAYPAQPYYPQQGYYPQQYGVQPMPQQGMPQQGVPYQQPVQQPYYPPQQGYVQPAPQGQMVPQQNMQPAPQGGATGTTQPQTSTQPTQQPMPQQPVTGGWQWPPQ
ncbi:MAG: hypothetical protein ACNI27_09545 [Desulfovibrio sp.]